ncbi:hypothetical protein N7462_002827 [Penicillium macrosclerotiorum]|uniref:uncharacterized protein n=1 Tax=Penicillium macrosclerotiorum TaxID=303699 RepID=UPI0025482E97|nr:uncharacterized protein N7462_002827 [Penicillium macrosclerotiorum]KAJ5693404.1 hypothetical protein N7462_002827 [Penicillium macrosclerotiorum]
MTPVNVTIAVLGATGTQGRGVVAALLKTTQANFSVIALTRDLNSEASRSLLDRHHGDTRLSLKSANAYDFNSLLQAFEGVYGVFAVTNTRLSGQIIQDEADMKHELIAGQNIINAAKICQIKHFVMSSLPSISNASNGRFSKVLHFDQKHDIEEMAQKELPATFVHPGMSSRSGSLRNSKLTILGLFYSNLNWPQYCLTKDEDGILHFVSPLSKEKRTGWVDPSYDIGIFVAGSSPLLECFNRLIFCQGPDKTVAKVYPVVGPQISTREMIETFEAATSRRAVAQPSTIKEWGERVSSSAGAGYREDIEQMMEWINIAPEDKICFGTVDPEEDLSLVDLGVCASSFREWIERTGWQGP